VPRRARTNVQLQVRWRARRPQLKRDPLGSARIGGRPLTIHYSATPDDVGALYSYALRHSWRFRLTLAVYSAVPALIWLLGSGRAPKPIDGVVSAIVALFVFSFIPLLAKWRTKTDLRTLSISPGGMDTSIGNLAGAVPWSKVHAIWDAGQHIFVLGTNLNGMAIPNRAFADPGQRAHFLAAAQQFLAAARAHGEGRAA
jgi:hypothetical protein